MREKREKKKSGKKRNIRRGKYAHGMEDSRLRGDRYPSPKRLVPASEHTSRGDRYPSPEYAYLQANRWREEKTFSARADSTGRQGSQSPVCSLWARVG